MKIMRTEKYKDLRDDIRKDIKVHEYCLSTGNKNALRLEKSIASHMAGNPYKRKHAKND